MTKIISKLLNPDEIEDKRKSAEGLVYQSELENIGREIARLQYHLAIWQYRNIHKQLRYKEFLGFDLTDEEKEQLLQLEENKCIFEENLGKKERDNPVNHSIGVK